MGKIKSLLAWTCHLVETIVICHGHLFTWFWRLYISSLSRLSVLLADNCGAILAMSIENIHSLLAVRCQPHGPSCLEIALQNQHQSINLQGVAWGNSWLKWNDLWMIRVPSGEDYIDGKMHFVINICRLIDAADAISQLQLCKCKYNCKCKHWYKQMHYEKLSSSMLSIGRFLCIGKPIDTWRKLTCNCSLFR